MNREQNAMLVLHRNTRPQHMRKAVFNQTSNIVISKTLDGTVATDGTAASGI